MDEICNLLCGLGLSTFEAEAIIKLLLASICGGLIGTEREMKGRPAGLKTFSLVCLGATLIMITNDFIFKFITNGTGDIVRMPAQVISGIGFLGAGSIMVTGLNRVRGLTTAASLWVTASIGIAIGSGFYRGALAGVLIVYVSSLGYNRIDQLIIRSSKAMGLYVEAETEEFMLKLLEYFKENNIKVVLLQRKSENKWYSKDSCATLEVCLEKRMMHELVLNDIKKIEGIRYIEEI